MKHKTDYFSNIDLLKPFKLYLRLHFTTESSKELVKWKVSTCFHTFINIVSADG